MECDKSNYIEYEHLSFAWEIFMFASNLLKESRDEGCRYIEFSRDGKIWVIGLKEIYVLSVKLVFGVLCDQYHDDYHFHTKTWNLIWRLKLRKPNQ